MCFAVCGDADFVALDGVGVCEEVKGGINSGRKIAANRRVTRIAFISSPGTNQGGNTALCQCCWLGGPSSKQGLPTAPNPNNPERKKGLEPTLAAEVDQDHNR